MTPDEARQVLVSARETANVHQWQDVYDLVFPVHQEQVLSGAEQGELAFLLGEACRGLESWDSAVYYYNEAVSTATGDAQTTARERLAEAGRIDAAVTAEDEGVVQGEAAAVLAAADDALNRQDFDAALDHYRAAYDGAVDGEPKYKAALGVARACAYLGHLDEAAPYAEYVAENASGETGGLGKSLQDWIRDQQAATGAIADGTSPDEFKETYETARTAYFSGAYDQALPLFVSIANAESLPGADRAKNAYNAGACNRLLGNDAEARTWFEFAADHGTAEVSAKAREHIDKIAREEAAHDLVGELAPD